MSQNQEVLDALECCIDGVTGADFPDVQRLASRITDLRQMGVPIGSRMVRVNGHKAAQYFLTGPIPDTVRRDEQLQATASGAPRCAIFDDDGLVTAA